MVVYGFSHLVTRPNSVLGRMFPEVMEIKNKDLNYDVPGHEIKQEVLQSER